MQRLAVGIGLGLATAAMLVACVGSSQDVAAQAACGAICRCEPANTTDDMIVACINDCAPEAASAPPACLDCIIENAGVCGDALGGLCDAACRTDATPQPRHLIFGGGS